MTDWDAELKKIDKQLESISDSALIPAPAKGAPPAAKAKVAADREATRTWPAFLRLGLATALAVGILFWPYPSRCGLGLAGYSAAVIAVTLGGLWSSVWTWRHRTARAHVLSLLLILWGLTLATVEVLPRIGYAKPDAARPEGLLCGTAVAPAPTTTAPTTTAPTTTAPAATPAPKP